jgi:hypothetical protein
MRLRLPAALAATVFALLLLARPASPARAAGEGGLVMASIVTYDIKTSDEAARVTWDVTLTDTDPATDITNGGSSYYATVGLPVLRGASEIVATDSSGYGLIVDTEDPGGQLIDEGAVVHFARGIFFGQTYTFRLTYTLADTRSQAVLVTPNYAFVPAIASGDSATVVVNTPSGDPWVTSIEAKDCPQSGNTLTCSGESKTYLAALVEVSQPGALSTSQFDVALKDKTVNVTLTYLQGEDASAQHQQALIAAGLPVIEQVYGFDYAGPGVLHVTQGGRQSSLGYEGLASCTPDVSCDIVVSPVAGDYTLLHELSHVFSSIYSKRWLAEGFAEFVAETAGPQLPEGVVVGSPPQRADTTVALALDDWGDASTLIGADASVLDIENAGYTFSIRFLQQLQQQYGIEALQAVNRNIATSGSQADSRRYMDLLEEATRSNLDSLFLTWIFPSSYRQAIADRRAAIDGLASLRTRLGDEGLSDDIATPIAADIRDWEFASALDKLAEAEGGLTTYVDLRGKLDDLKSDAETAGLTFPTGLDDSLNRFDFQNVSTAIDRGEQAITSYRDAQRVVGQSRNIWQGFGLLGSSPGGALDDSAQSFASGDFDASLAHSRHAIDLVNDASSVAFRRMLVVAGFLGLLVLAVGIAVVVGRLREREFAER